MGCKPCRVCWKPVLVGGVHPSGVRCARHTEVQTPSTGPQVTSPVPDLGSLTVEELRALAAQRGIEVGSARRKAELVDVITHTSIEE